MDKGASFPQFHMYGWTLIFHNEVVAELDYLHVSQPVHVFKIATCVDKARLLDIFCILEDLSREPDKGCLLFKQL